MQISASRILELLRFRDELRELPTSESFNHVVLELHLDLTKI